ncbi:MAG: methyltransferase domain-containing protein [Acidimicrobiia bacterium]|nr:methyltransferase domain-containing protein [Acidimicrobiia bacterium]
MNQAHLEFLSSDAWHELLRDTIVPYALGAADLGDDLLEIGPGPGKTTELLRARVAALTAVELDELLAAELAERLAGTNVEVVHADATDMPFPDGRFSGAVSFTMLHHVPTGALQDQIFAEVARVLRPGAVFVASDSLASERLESFHEDDIYNPVDPATVESRLVVAGFASADVDVHDYGWCARAVAR